MNWSQKARSGLDVALAILRKARADRVGLDDHFIREAAASAFAVLRSRNKQIAAARLWRDWDRLGLKAVLENIRSKTRIVDT
jgi:hypothetical protein